MALPDRLRFRPPRLELPPELGWLLAAAFAPPPAPAPSGQDPARLADLAVELSLGHRLVARQGDARIRAWFGPAADLLVTMRRRATVRELAARQAAAEVAAVAAEHDIPILFLKGFALVQLLPGPAGWRPFADLDVLAPAASAAALDEALVAIGYDRLPIPPNEQHLSPLEAPSGLKVDLHFRLRGVTLSAGWSDAAELIDAGLCEPIPELPGPARIPGPALLTAHLLVHGIEQHGLVPKNYPLMRLVADLSDLLPEDGDWRRHLGPGWGWIRQTVTAAEVDALCDLAVVLRQGRLPRGDRPRERDAELVLRHVIAGQRDERYRRALRRDHLLGRLRMARRQRELLRYILRRLRGLWPIGPRRSLH